MKKPDRIIPLNCVDKSFLAADSKHERMVYHWVLDIEGDINAVKLNQALLSSLQSCPRMRTLICSSPFRLYRQIQEDFKQATLNVIALFELQNENNLNDMQINDLYEKSLFEWINQFMDVRRELPLKVLLLRKNKVESSLIFTFHHYATDGICSLLFMKDVIGRYNDRIPDDSSLLGRTHPPTEGDELLKLAFSHRSKVKHFYRNATLNLLHRLFIGPFLSSTKIYHDKPERAEEISFCSATLSPQDLMQIKSKLKPQGFTINDILVAACFKTIENWNNLHGKKSKRITIMVPLDIGPEELKYFISNQVSHLSFATSCEERADPTELLRIVRIRVASIIDSGIGYAWIFFIYLCSHLPLSITRALTQLPKYTGVYIESMMLTNLGLIWAKDSDAEEGVIKLGNAKIVGIRGATMVGRPMPMNIYIGTYNNNLNISLTYKIGLFSDKQAQRFLDTYLKELKNYPIG